MLSYLPSNAGAQAAFLPEAVAPNHLRGLRGDIATIRSILERGRSSYFETGTIFESEAVT